MSDHKSLPRVIPLEERLAFASAHALPRPAAPAEEITYKQDGKELPPGAVPDFSREYEFKRRVVDTSAPAKEGYWIQRAKMAWPNLEIEGDGAWAFVSQCEKMVHLFATRAEMVAAVCWSRDCDPIRGHDRVRIRYLKPMRVPGSWED